MVFDLYFFAERLTLLSVIGLIITIGALIVISKPEKEKIIIDVLPVFHIPMDIARSPIYFPARDIFCEHCDCGQGYFIVYPPSVTSVVPVVKDAASDAR